MINLFESTQSDAQVAQVALAYSHFETASNSVLLTCSRILKKNQESQAPFQFPHDEALVAHLLSIEEPVCCEVRLPKNLNLPFVLSGIWINALMVNSIQDELGSAMHDLFDEKWTPSPKVAPTPPQNLTSVNWMDLLEHERIPTDVVFKVIQQPNNNEGEGDEKVLGEVCKKHFY